MRITAIRETFEEVGLLLCKPRTGECDQIYSHVEESFDRKNWQKKVHNDSTKFLDLCKELEVIPDLWSLHEWAAWETPATFKKRLIIFHNLYFDFFFNENESLDLKLLSI